MKDWRVHNLSQTVNGQRRLSIITQEIDHPDKDVDMLQNGSLKQSSHCVGFLCCFVAVHTLSSVILAPHELFYYMSNSSYKTSENIDNLYTF
jgi:hypothetical protein